LGLLMRNVLLAALVLAVAACGAYRFPGGAPPGDGTVSGAVLAFPCFPVEQPVGLPVGQPAAQPALPCVGPCPQFAMCVNPCPLIAQPAAQAAPMCVSPCPPIPQPADQPLAQCTPSPVGGGAAIPCLPIESAGAAQCAGRPVPGVEIDFTSAGEAAKAVTDSAGRFTATLAAGTWTVHLVTNLHLMSGPHQVTVVSGSTVTVIYVVDSGIRVPVPQQ
jgi:hypothetical protein